VILLEIMEHLKMIARKYNTCVLFTNRVGPGILAPAGGNILIDYSDFIISLEKPSETGNDRVVRLVKSPNQPEAMKHFTITENGIKNA
jgi:RecA/RadA recombinase